MRGDVLGDARPLADVLNGFVDGHAIQGLSGRHAGKQPSLGPVELVVFAQHLQQVLGQLGIPLLLALALAHPQQHA